MDLLYKRIEELADQKAAAEAANIELQRQNDYFKELFSKQCEGLVKSSETNQELLNQNSQEFSTFTEKRLHSLTNQTSELSIDSQNNRTGENLSYLDKEKQSFIDLSYEDLEQDFAQFKKRQRLDNDFFFSNSADKQTVLQRIPSSSSLRGLKNESSLQSEVTDNKFEDNEISVDDMLLERSSPQSNSSLNFFGLAIVFGAIGMISMVSDAPSQPLVSTINSGNRLKSNLRTNTESSSITEQVIEDYTQLEYTPLQLLWIALDLTKQALMTLPLVAYISFAFSLLFLVFFAASYFSHTKIRPSTSRQRRSHNGHRKIKPSNKIDSKKSKSTRENSLEINA